MPLYEYRCQVCDHYFEELTSFDKSNKMVCPKCGNPDVKKLISSFTTISNTTTPICEQSSNCQKPGCPYSQN
jgi:putative FmdB family regulatory protein